MFEKLYDDWYGINDVYVTPEEVKYQQPDPVSSHAPLGESKYDP
jgi:hypothetical protein